MKWYKSKTFWAGVLKVLAGISLGIADQLVAGITLTVAGVVTIVLRIVTKEAIEW